MSFEPSCIVYGATKGALVAPDDFALRIEADPTFGASQILWAAITNAGIQLEVLPAISESDAALHLPGLLERLIGREIPQISRVFISHPIST